MMMMSLLRSAALLWMLGFAVSACETDGLAGPRSEESGYSFVTGPLMKPGDNCRACHGASASAYPEAPPWSVAGTVFEGLQSDVGAEGVKVVVRQADGKELETITNTVGNFYFAQPVVAPYSVSLVRGAVSVTMSVPPPAGGCNACHARSPLAGAPGHLFIPSPGDFASLAECDGDHTVTILDTQYDCAPYRCDAAEGACRHRCTSDDDCAAGTRCSAGACRTGT
jgi:hypothetical protein